MGAYWKKLGWIWVWRHVRLGLAPRPLGVGATSAWGSRRRYRSTRSMILIALSTCDFHVMG
jgi:hypothetical protein